MCAQLDAMVVIPTFHTMESEYTRIRQDNHILSRIFDISIPVHT